MKLMTGAYFVTEASLPPIDELDLYEVFESAGGSIFKLHESTKRGHMIEGIAGSSSKPFGAHRSALLPIITTRLRRRLPRYVLFRLMAPQASGMPIRKAITRGAMIAMAAV